MGEAVPKAHGPEREQRGSPQTCLLAEPRGEERRERREKQPEEQEGQRRSWAQGGGEGSQGGKPRGGEGLRRQRGPAGAGLPLAICSEGRGAHGHGESPDPRKDFIEFQSGPASSKSGVVRSKATSSTLRLTQLYFCK